MKLAWFDPAAGAAGDMILAALLDAGGPPEVLDAVVAGLGLEGVTVVTEPAKSHGLGGLKVTVTMPPEQPHRHLHHITDRIAASGLSARVIEQATAIFTRLGEAEARVHRIPIERVHFHEVGAVDAMVDIVGTVALLEALGVEQVHCGPLPVSSGWVDCAHGRLPVPAPATQELLLGVPTEPLAVTGETLTPTGAAILTTLASGYAMPAMTPAAIGRGVGTKDFGIPNLLRVVIGEDSTTAGTVVVIEANIDDMSPEWYPLAAERLFAVGALDVTYSPLQMKKGRPGVLLRVLAEPAQREQVIDAVLLHTTSLGVRWYLGQRECLERTQLQVPTPFGTIDVKVGWRDGKVYNLAVEHESARVAAVEQQVSLAVVDAAAREGARRLLAKAGATSTDKEKH